MKITYNAPIVLTYTLICSVLMLLDNILGQGSVMQYFSVGGTLHLQEPAFYFSLISHVFGHSNWEHLVGNFSFILLLGPILEEKYGSRTMGFMVLITAVFTGFLNILIFDTGLLGASGIVFMMILLSSFVNVKKGTIPLTFILILLLYLGREIWTAITVEDQISQFAHILGGFCGAGFGFMSKGKNIQVPGPKL